MNKILLPGFFCALIIAGGFYFLNLHTFPTGKYAGPVQELRLGVSKAGPQLSALIYIAQNKGYFTDNKLHVEFTIEPDSAASRKDVATGTQDVATTSDFGFVTDSFTPTNLRILAVISNTNLIEIIGRKDRGIITPKDLKRKKIAVTLKSYSEFFLGKFLEFNNLKLSDVTVVPTNLDKVQDAIVSGKVDIAVTNDPFAYQIKQALGENTVVLQPQINRNNNLLLISNEQAIKFKTEAIERFLAALLQAEDFIKANPGESKQIIMKQFDLDQDFINQNWPKNTFTVRLDQSLLLEMEDEALWVIENKLTDKTAIPRYRDYISRDFLKKIKMAAVTAF